MEGFPCPTDCQVEIDNEPGWLSVVEQDQGKSPLVMNLKFQAADVKKPLIAVKRIVDMGNYVHFGPGDGDRRFEGKR